MKIESYRSLSAFDELREEWNQLLQNSRANTIFLTVEWQETWWQAYHPGTLWLLTFRTDGNDLVGVAPWFIDDQDGQLTVRTVGCVDVTDYLEVIVHQDHEQAVFETLAAYLAEDNGTYHAIDLCNIPEQSPTLAYLPDLLHSSGFDVVVEAQEVCPIINLPDAWEDYLAALNKKQRHELRRKLRRASGAGSSLDWYTVGPEHDLGVELDCFLQLMAASSEEKRAFLQDARHVSFFKMLVPKMMAQGWLNLNFLTVNEQAVASYLNFDYNNRILVYNSGQDLQEFGHLSPGIVLLANNIRHAIEANRVVFDFLRGDEYYKYQMGGQDTQVKMLMAKRA